MNKLVSIVVPCYNQGRFLSEALQSVLSQTYKHWECIIVNDGSPDKTKQVASNWVNRDIRFSYIEQANGGLSSARNAGIRQSKGEFIITLDADDILHCDYIHKLLPVLLQNKDVNIVSCNQYFFSGSMDHILDTYRSEDGDLGSLLFENQIMSPAIYRKVDWVRVGGYDELMKFGFEDWEFWISILKTNGKYKVVDEFLFYYRKSKKSMLIDTLENHRLKILEYVIKKHKDIYHNKFDNTISYLLFLSNLYWQSEKKYKNSIEFKIGRMLFWPIKFLNKILFR